MPSVISRDGTRIGFETEGEGPPLIVVDGSLCYREAGPARLLTAALRKHFAVTIYDRRGRGESGDTQPYAVDREVEDIGALIAGAGGSAYLFGISAGALLALEAAGRLPGVSRLALFEVPLVVDAKRNPLTADEVARIERLVEEGDRGRAVKRFLKSQGVPGIMITVTRIVPGWNRLTALAHTLRYEMAILAPVQQGRPIPPALWPNVTMPTLVIEGARSPAWLRNAQQAAVAALPNAECRRARGQTHFFNPGKIAPLLEEFFLK